MKMTDNYIKYISIEDGSNLYDKYSENIDLIDNIDYTNTSDSPKVRKNIVIKFSVNEPDLQDGQKYTFERIENNNYKLNSYEEIIELIEEIECKNIILNNIVPIYNEFIKFPAPINYGFVIPKNQFKLDLPAIQEVAQKYFKEIKKVTQKDSHIHFLANFK